MRMATEARGAAHALLLCHVLQVLHQLARKPQPPELWRDGHCSHVPMPQLPLPLRLAQHWHASEPAGRAGGDWASLLHAP